MRPLHQLATTKPKTLAWLLIVAALVLTAGLATSSASALSRPTVVTINGEQYGCARAPRVLRIPLPPAARPDIGAAEAGTREGVAVKPAHICPRGEVPRIPGARLSSAPAPPKTKMKPKTSVSSASPSTSISTTASGSIGSSPGVDVPVTQFGSYYYYASESADVDAATAFGGYVSEQQESLSADDLGDHSLSQIWADSESPDGNYSDIELGTTTDPNFNNGAPTLFTFFFDNGQPGCYNLGCGFVQVANVVGYVPGYPIAAAPLLHAGAAHLYQVYEDPNVSGQWWVAVDGVPIGYYPPTTWPQLPLTSLNLVKAGGEVALPSPNAASTMGDGYLGSNPGDAAAYWSNLQYWANGVWTTPAVSDVGEYANAPDYYDLSNLPDAAAGWGVGGWSFSYGGPGSCSAPSPACSAQAAGSPAPVSTTAVAKPKAKGKSKAKSRRNHSRKRSRRNRRR